MNCPAGVEAEIADFETGKLRDASARVVHERQQHPISKPRAGRQIRGVEQCSNLAGLQVADDSALEPLARDCQDALGDREQEWIRCRRVAKKGPDGRQPCVSASRAVVACAFEVVEKREHAVGVDALRAKIVGLEAPLRLEESQEQLERVPVCRDRAIAEPPLVDQVVAEVALQDRAK